MRAHRRHHEREGHRESSPNCGGWVGAYVTLGAFSEVTQREVIDDEYPILLVPGRRVAQEIDRAAREAGLGGLKACLEAIDATYDKLVINRRTEEILREIAPSVT